MDDRKGYIYVIVNKINGKYYYGKSYNIQSRWKDHKINASQKINRKLYDAMNHYGHDNFSVHQIKEIVEDKETITKSLNVLETYFIGFSMSNDPVFGYNMTNGGDGGDVLSHNPRREEIIEKTRKSNKGKKRSIEFCEKMSQIAKNTDPEIKKIKGERSAESNKKRIKEKGYTEKEIESHKKNTVRLIEYNKSEEGRKRTSERFKGKKHKPFSEEHRRNIGKTSRGRLIPGKKIIVDDILYVTLHDASRKLKIPMSTLKNRLINDNFPNYQYII